MDGWTDLALSHCASDDFRPSAIKVLLKLILLYLVLAALCHTEYLFREKSIEIEGHVEAVGETRQRMGKRSVPATLVRYHYRDPLNGKPRFNTVTVPQSHTPSGKVTIEYIAGQPPRTRLKQQAVPVMVHVFFWLNVTMLSVIVCTILWIAWDRKRPIPHSYERRVRLRKT